VIDERIDVKLLGEAAKMRPALAIRDDRSGGENQRRRFAALGEYSLSRRKRLSELPAYLSGWDVALMPFALNESTKYISPTKTPEYLAAGKPVVSTPIRDVVRPYGELGLVHIAETAEAFVAACDKALREDSGERLKRADEFLSQTSWDKTWTQMANLIDEAILPQGIKLAIV
jgi:UDP-galactopyranose mutase